jgi:hypothetical protein
MTNIKDKLTGFYLSKVLFAILGLFIVYNAIKYMVNGLIAIVNKSGDIPPDCGILLPIGLFFFVSGLIPLISGIVLKKKHNNFIKVVVFVVNVLIVYFVLLKWILEL